jgi:hypothetical protein
MRRAVLPSSAFSWITSAVPPPVNTECGPSSSVMPGATTLAVEPPLASTVKFGMSPAWGPCGLSAPCCLCSGLKWPPADLKSGPSHLAASWMWIAWSPAGRPLTASVIFTPPGAGASLAVPMLLPAASLSLTVIGLAGAGFLSAGLAVSARAEPATRETNRVGSRSVFIGGNLRMSGARRPVLDRPEPRPSALAQPSSSWPRGAAWMSATTAKWSDGHTPPTG